MRAWALLLAGGPRNTFVENLAFSAGAVSIGISAVLHLHLWMAGYSGVHIIGPLFLVQAIAGLLIAATVILVRRSWVAALGFGYLAATIAGFLLSVTIGLFGFQDSWWAPFARAAFWDEIAGTVVLVAGGAICTIRFLAGPRHGHQTRPTVPDPLAPGP